MVGPTLVDIRERIESLASADGEYCLVCARTGERPIPAAGHWFPDRETARRAARATEQYRAALRRYDPRLPYHDVVVTQETVVRSGAAHTECAEESAWGLSEPILTGRSTAPEDSRRVAFCHGVTAAVFEALSVGGYRDVEIAVMDAYFDFAERVQDPDDLCRCLLESMATEVADRLDASEQAAVLREAATRLEPVEEGDQSVRGTFALCDELGLLGSYSRSPWSIDDTGVRRVDVEISEYALSPQDGRLPVLPVVLDLYRRRLDGELTQVRVHETAAGWQLTLRFPTDGRPAGLASAPIAEGS